MFSGMVSGLEFEMVLGMVMDMISELDMALGMPSESKSIGHVCYEEIHTV